MCITKISHQSHPQKRFYFKLSTQELTRQPQSDKIKNPSSTKFADPQRPLHQACDLANRPLDPDTILLMNKTSLLKPQTSKIQSHRPKGINSLKHVVDITLKLLGTQSRCFDGKKNPPQRYAADEDLPEAPNQGYDVAMMDAAGDCAPNGGQEQDNNQINGPTGRAAARRARFL